MVVDPRHGIGDFGFDTIGIDNENGFGVGIAWRIIGFHGADGGAGP